MKKVVNILCVGLALTLFCCKKTEKEDTQVKEVSSGNELLTDEVALSERATYVQTPEKESEGIERSFENAPPLIPHVVKNYVITQRKNECLNCHIPNDDGELDAISVPKSHFTDFRPKIEAKDGLYVVDVEENEVVANSTGNELNRAMYNCNLCHVPQTEITVDIKNLFEPDFRSSKSKKESNLGETIAEGVN